MNKKLLLLLITLALPFSTIHIHAEEIEEENSPVEEIINNTEILEEGKETEIIFPELEEETFKTEDIVSNEEEILEQPVVENLELIQEETIIPTLETPVEVVSDSVFIEEPAVEIYSVPEAVEEPAPQVEPDIILESAELNADVGKEENIIIEEAAAPVKSTMLITDTTVDEKPIILTSTPEVEVEEESKDLTVNVTNILRINNNAKDVDGNPIQTSVDGHAIAWDNTYTLVDGQSKLASGFNSMVGGKNAGAGGVGYNYTFQNEFVLTEEGGNPVYIDENENPYIQKVQYKDGNTIVYFKDGTSQTYDNANSICISPVYKAKENWYLEYNYVDEISTGSGS